VKIIALEKAKPEKDEPTQPGQFEKRTALAWDGVYQTGHAPAALSRRRRCGPTIRCLIGCIFTVEMNQQLIMRRLV
jgi:hypothetical protein